MFVAAPWNIKLGIIVRDQKTLKEAELANKYFRSFFQNKFGIKIAENSTGTKATRNENCNKCLRLSH
jgi:hypothetical protein